MNRDVCEHFNPVDLPCEKCKSANVQKSTLREAAQQALEAMESADVDPHSSDAVYTAITALKAALVKHDKDRVKVEEMKANWALQRKLAEETQERDKQQREYEEQRLAALAEPVQECPHGVTDGNCKECYGKATNSEPFTVYTTLRQREWPALWTGCPNCASLEDQNAELDRKLAELEQTSLELCETCGWRTVIPGEGCLNCARSKPLNIERLRDALVTSRIIPPAAVEDPDEYDDGVTLFRIEALHRRIT